MARRFPTSPRSFDNPSQSQFSSSYRPEHRAPPRSPNASRTYQRGPLPLMIPNSSRPPSPPPALPPPTFIQDLAEGRDLSWEWSNHKVKPETSGSRPVSPGTHAWERRDSGHRPAELWESRRRESSASTSTLHSPTIADVLSMGSQDEGYGSLSGTSLLHLQGERPLDQQNRKDSSHAYDNKLKAKIGRPKTPTRASTAGSIDSSPAPLGTTRFGAAQTTRPPQLKTLSLSDRSLSASSDSPFKVTSPFSSKFAHSPQSAAASPGFVSSANSAQSFSTDLRRSPTFDTTSVASSHTSLGGSLLSEMAGEQKFGRIKPSPARSKGTDSNLSLAMMAVSAAAAAGGGGGGSSSVQTHGRGVAGASRGTFKRGSHGSLEHGNPTGGFPSGHPQAAGANLSPGESETGDPLLALAPEPGRDVRHLQHLQLEDHHQYQYQYPPPPQPPRSNLNHSNPSLPRLHSQPSRSGMKRRASSPPDEPTLEDRQAASAQAPPQPQGAVGEQQRRTPGQHHPLAKRASPVFHHHQPRPSQSSYSSDPSAGLPPNGSYASTLPVAASSTIASSHDRLSPAALAKSVKQESHASPYMSQLSLDPGLQGPDPQNQAQYTLDATQQLAAAAAQKVSAENVSRLKQQNPPKHAASHHICDCCPKKPKKFDTIEELRHHQAEKQYVCQYCHNRFKNKNEAERHQNSLHLRRHSWSCATLERNFEAAFHPCNATPPNTTGNAQPPHPSGAIAPFDVCGYCGEEFPNLPQPDWLARGEHLTHVHKFSECNQSKKFYRADHFRQHLKHSHGGTSGKWTNMLEAACMKEEPPVTPEAQSQEQLRLQQQQQVQAAHAAQAAQIAAQQAQQAHVSQGEPPVLTSYQAAQLQGASAAPVANMMGQGVRQGPYPAMSMAQSNAVENIQFSGMPEDGSK